MINTHLSPGQPMHSTVQNTHGITAPSAIVVMLSCLSTHWHLAIWYLWPNHTTTSTQFDSAVVSPTSCIGTLILACLHAHHEQNEPILTVGIEQWNSGGHDPCHLWVPDILRAPGGQQQGGRQRTQLRHSPDHR